MCDLHLRATSAWRSSVIRNHFPTSIGNIFGKHWSTFIAISMSIISFPMRMIFYKRFSIIPLSYWPLMGKDLPFVCLFSHLNDVSWPWSSSVQFRCRRIRPNSTPNSISVRCSSFEWNRTKKASESFNVYSHERNFVPMKNVNVINDEEEEIHLRVEHRCLSLRWTGEFSWIAGRTLCNVVRRWNAFPRSERIREERIQWREHQGEGSNTNDWRSSQIKVKGQQIWATNHDSSHINIDSQTRHECEQTLHRSVDTRVARSSAFWSFFRILSALPLFSAFPWKYDQHYRKPRTRGENQNREIFDVWIQKISFSTAIS